ncbi:tRNA (guanine(37)-N1)-methyltransferase [Copidosoma floridanum]|uniref:tRNA (guanine(37)-N1)-methyltransferase n=1 Tax=Copidosoma floridanum TaxID=29053 RepID=UPI0006C9CB64|nr:tRNA (guanine(37)-N1)-methyltransferase [Copidosoma floridanum]
MTSLLVPPSSVRSQAKVDHEAFKVKVDNVPCLLLSHKIFNEYKNTIRKILLKFPKFKPVQAHEDKEEGKCVVYLDPQKMKDVSDDFKQEIMWDQVYLEKELHLSYENWPCNDVLCAVLPKDVEVPTSYSIIGHILHMNLRKELLPFKKAIGQIFLDKTPNIKTVVNKLDIIDNTYRNFAMEILAGEENTVVSVKENGVTYHFDFAKVYWNPRLATEHKVLVNFLKSDDVLYDVFAGVGPFSIPAARKGVRVLANDLNPESHKWLLKNAEVNKVKKLISPFNKDGKDFLRDDVKKDILERREKNLPGSEHLAMNLPAIAVEFLDVFRDWLTTDEMEKVYSKPPTVHVYCFLKAAKTEDFSALAKELVEKHLGAKLDANAIVDVHHVRNVAPNKEMIS